MICTGFENLFTDIIDTTTKENNSTLIEASEKVFETKMVGKKLIKLNINTGESWEWNSGTECWDYMKTERPAHRDPYFAKR